MPGKRQTINLLLSVFFLLAIVLLPVTVTAVYDPPHNEASDVHCNGCHGKTLGIAGGSPFWTDNTADTAYNSICLRCHITEPNAAEAYGGESAPVVQSHAPDGTVIKCTVCHNNHEQAQIYPGKYNQNKFFVATGTKNSIDPYDEGSDTTTIHYSSLTGKGDWVNLTSLAEKTGVNRGAMLVPDISATSSRWPVYMVDSIDIDPDGDPGTDDGTITIKGEITSASNFGIFYGQLIRSMMRVNSQTKYVEFYDRTGTKSFTSANGPYGICQICHADTSHWSAAAPPGDKHFSAWNCSE